MFTSDSTGIDDPVIFCLHYLGGSAREWSRVREAAAHGARYVALDLPGFGDAARGTGYSVEEMATAIADAIRLRAPKRWSIAGHSMGAKVAAVVARRAEDGERGLAGLEGLVLVASSPPAPEPMDESQRRTMLGWFAGDAASSRAEAQTYVDQNAIALEPEAAATAVADVLRANRAAWRAWLEGGSREDWADRVGVLRTPALIVAGASDEQLGPDAQRRLTAPHFAHVRTVVLDGAKHLLPLERPDELARLIAEHVAAVEETHDRGRALGAAYRELIASDRVSERTRRALSDRDRPDDPAYEPQAIGGPALATLRAVVRRVVPQDGPEPIDLAARIDRQLQAGEGDGWRHASLPPDAEAYATGLLTLDEQTLRALGQGFASLDGAAQDGVLGRVAGGSFGATDGTAGRFDARQMRAWFEDVRADAVELYVAHPATLARMGYSGIAYGGDGEPKTGFARVGPGEREPWEPVAAADLAR